ncbi:putative membrane protein [Agromyces flavus]|uniref:Membrane protein n=1 Tax=Agromyces flavus TaxID=589382 RepID=A0A1H1UWD6_9MICO|nr:DUF1622 domain-containing protein [Agromyces flavus]MCP2368131.1 putative membrane protein [Agromyces flavus]GGI47592.1 hypothetical protein GCM10010932_22800 [Agromyces flavus]SDS76426.1 Uncharacterized membrane protein [Agromyces flavus]
MEFGTVITRVGEVIDIIGVVAIVVGVLYALTDAAVRRLRRTGPVYARFRRVLGRGILIGLELLVAADIIRTVAVTPTMESVAVLGLIVLIRTFLSWSLEVEIAGRWPWQKARLGTIDDEVADAPAAPAPTGGAERA